jgi:hypothetical protein
MSPMIPFRPLIAVLAFVALAGGILQAAAVDAPPTTFVVNVSGAGFDPPVCKISRRDVVAWKNVGSKPIRVVLPDPNSATPIYDSGMINPGQVSLAYAGFEAPSHWRFQDAADSSHVGLVITPVFTNTVDPECTPTGSLPPGPLPRGPIVPALAADK